MTDTIAPRGDRTDIVRAPTTKLTIVYDETCEFCRHCRDWLATQPCLVEVDLLAAGTPEARARFGSVSPPRNDLIVADDQGRVWIGPPAFVVCLWATARYRAWAFRLSRRTWSTAAERFFLEVSRRRRRGDASDHDCDRCFVAAEEKAG